MCDFRKRELVLRGDFPLEVHEALVVDVVDVDGPDVGERLDRGRWGRGRVDVAAVKRELVGGEGAPAERGAALHVGERSPRPADLDGEADGDEGLFGT